MIEREEIQELARVALHWKSRDDGTHNRVADIILKLIREFEYLAPLGQKGEPCWVVRDQRAPWEKSSQRVRVFPRKVPLDEFGQLHLADQQSSREYRESLWEELEPGTQVQGKIILVEE